MRKNKTNDMVEYFISHFPCIISQDSLAQEFNVSVRQIKNYIKQINFITFPAIFIENISNNSFRLCDSYIDYLSKFDTTEYLPKERQSILISKLLLSSSPLNVFDLEEELYVSRPTLENDFLKIRKIITSFDLTLTISKDLLLLNGSEKNKRKLTSYMITNDNYINFISSQNLKYLNNNYQINTIKEKIMLIFQEYHMVCTDYSLTNIVMHLVVTVDRIKRKCELTDILPPGNINIVDQQITDKIQAFIEEAFSISFSQTEHSNLLLFISCNLGAVDYSFINLNNQKDVVTEECHFITKEIINMMQNDYYLAEFEEIFITRFMLHLNNLLKRIENNFSIRNPLALEFKLTYPLVYDIAVSAANIILEHKKTLISQDEIAFIAFHIGSLVETNKQNNQRFSAIYVYTDYHGYYHHNIEKIQKLFNEKVDIKYTISLNDYLLAKPNADIVFTELNVGIENSFFISPFITDSEISRLYSKIDSMEAHKNDLEFQENLSTMFRKELFFSNITTYDRTDTFHFLFENLEKLDLFLPDFPDEVLRREQLSSTAFFNDIAIPHAISQNVKKSFISICHSENGVVWENQTVHLVIIIGIAYKERTIFRSIFNQIIAILSTPANVKKMNEAKTYTEFIHTIYNLRNNTF